MSGVVPSDISKSAKGNSTNGDDIVYPSKADNCMHLESSPIAWAYNCVYYQCPTIGIQPDFMDGLDVVNKCVNDSISIVKRLLTKCKHSSFTNVDLEKCN